MNMSKATMLRYAIAAISFHLTINLIVFALYGAEQAIWFLTGYGYAMFLKGLVDTPIFLLPAILTIVIVRLIPRHIRLRTSAVSALTGAATVALFLLAAEATARTAMGVAIWRSEVPLCVYGKQSFATSLTDLVRSIGFFGDDFRSNHHALAATSGRRILTWSYRTLSFVPTEDNPRYIQPYLVPDDCSEVYDS